MYTRKLLLLGSLLLCLGACQRELGVELPYEGNRLVIFGLLSADSVISVKISKTASPTGVYLYGQQVDDATAELVEDGTPVQILEHAGNSIYRSPDAFKPKAGKGYSLRVTAPGFPPAETAVEVIPAEVRIAQYVFRDTLSSPFTGDVARKLTFTFQDQQEERDFYYAKVEGQYRGYPVLLNSFIADRPLEGSEDLCSFRSEDNQYVLQDVCFNGQSFAFHIGVSMKGAVQNIQDPDKRPGQEVACDQIVLKLRKITGTYREYLYLAGREEDGFLKAFTTPIREYTNVKGGYGLWAAYSEDVINVLN